MGRVPAARRTEGRSDLSASAESITQHYGRIPRQDTRTAGLKMYSPPLARLEDRENLARVH